MNDKKSVSTLLSLIKKYPLDKEERQAIRNAIGVLGWTMHAEKKIETLKKRRENKKEK